MAEKIAEKLVSWLPIILKSFKPFTTDMQKFQINYREKTSEIFYKINMGDSHIRKKLAKIKIPNSGNYSIKGFFDEGWTDYSRLIKIDRHSNAYIINPKELPDSKFFVAILKGMIDPNGLKRIVYVQPAVNQNSTKVYDKYWLQASIRDIRIMEKLYKSLEIDEVNCSFNIAIDKYFSADLPSDLKKTAEIVQNFILAGQGRNKAEMFKAWRSFYRMTSKESLLENLYDNLFDNVKLREYVSVNLPFRLGKVGPHKIENYLPVSFKTEALTKLTLDEPQARGTLKFNKKKFKEAIDIHVKNNQK